MELTKRLAWRTKKDQFFQSAGCGQTHTMNFIKALFLRVAGRSCPSHRLRAERAMRRP